MELHIYADRTMRRARFAPVDFLCTGESYAVTLHGMDGATTSGLSLKLYNSATVVAEATGFADVATKSDERTCALVTTTSAMSAWLQATGGAPVMKQVELVIRDGATVFASCTVPIRLLPA